MESGWAWLADLLAVGSAWGCRSRAGLRQPAFTDAPGDSPGADGHKSGAREDTRGRGGCGAMGRPKSAWEAALERSDCAVTALEPKGSAPPQVSGGAAGEPACRPGSVHPLARAGGHPSGTAVAGSLVRSTRELGRAALKHSRSRPKPAF